MATALASSPEAMLADAVAGFYADPLGFVLFAFPWGEKGTELEHETGPDENQREFLKSLGEEVKQRRFDGKNPVLPIMMNATSGHGTGKSAMGGWLACWILSTRPNSIGTVTAGTYQQLKSRTWAAVKRWMKLCITRDWFEIQAEAIISKVAPETWKLVIQTCAEENAQAFAGQHAKDSTSWYLFDEASNIPDAVFEVAYGGLTDGHPMMFAWGQMARNTGEFYRICFGSLKERWNGRCWDSRSSRFTNKATIDQWLADYGEDSDFFRVRVRGLPPLASELQFIDFVRIREAQNRQVETLDDEPILAGFDVSGGGSAWNVIRFRCGLDARSIPPVRISGEQGRDRNILIAKAAEIMKDGVMYKNRRRKVEALFIDSAFGAPIYERLQVLGYRNVHEVNFGGASPDRHQLNMRAYMANECKDWLLKGAIPEPNSKDDCGLAQQLGLPGASLNSSNKLVIESKKSIVDRGEQSPDDGDALWLTFARKVAPHAANRIPLQAVVPSRTWG